MDELSYLQPRSFSILHNGFNFEIVVCHEYFADASDSNDPLDGIDFTGNYLLTMLTPQGTIQTVIDQSGDEPADNSVDLNGELYKKILAKLAEPRS